MAIQHDIFSNDTHLGRCFQELYKQLMTGQEVSYRSVFEPVYSALTKMEPKDYPPLQKAWSLSNHPRTQALYLTLKKAVRIARKELEAREPGCWKTNDKNKGTLFWYVGTDCDPLREERQYATMMNVRRYVEFCQNTDGLIPRVWTDYFLSNTKDLLRIRENRNQQVIQADIRDLTNLHLLPRIYEAIVGRKALSFTYEDFYGNKFEEMVFHPQLLREYNGRWQVFGETEAFRHLLDLPFYNIALDRIVGGVSESDDKYRAAPAARYTDYFRPMVGVTRRDLIHPQGGSPTIYTIRVRALRQQVFGLITTKKLHPLQRTVVEWGTHSDGAYGEVSFDAMMNYELLGSLLQLGTGVKVVGSEEVVRFMREQAKLLAELYEIGS